MNITSISFHGSNPSMGPHDEPSSNALQMGGYPDALRELLDDTRVNGKVTMREYLQLHLDGRSKEIEAVHRAQDVERLADGARIINLEIDFEGGRAVTLSDLRRFSLEGDGYRAFNELIREKGTVSQPGSPFEEDGLKAPEPGGVPDWE